MQVCLLLTCGFLVAARAIDPSNCDKFASAEPAQFLANTSVFTIWAEGILSRLRQDGMVFIRDTPFVTAEEIAHLRSSLEVSFQTGSDLGKEYGRRGVFDRTAVASGIFNVVGDVGQAHILPHSEGAYMPTTASFVLFACPGPASKGGATPAVEIQNVQKEVQLRLPALYAKIYEHGVWYVRFFPDDWSKEFTAFTEANYPTMRSRYGNRSREEIVEELRSQNTTWVWWTNGSRELSPPVRNVAPWAWNTSGKEAIESGSGLEIWWWMPGFYVEDDETPTNVWFNQIALLNGRYLRSVSDGLKQLPQIGRAHV